MKNNNSKRQPQAVLKRKIVVGDKIIHIHSVFCGTVTLEKALYNIISRKLANTS